MNNALLTLICMAESIKTLTHEGFSNAQVSSRPVLQQRRKCPMPQTGIEIWSILFKSSMHSEFPQGVFSNKEPALFHLTNYHH
jgi:hypothetical protein